ncbi:hypothetical protein ACIRVF_18170 [Kitasatospora sp. NPDC101157]|uniref:hypothetical protein n=1 Tax=Kitasatospora sp. NPDC101157 TaxID=3364098 RepID=UPI00382DE948
MTDSASVTVSPASSGTVRNPPRSATARTARRTCHQGAPSTAGTIRANNTVCGFRHPVSTEHSTPPSAEPPAIR